MTKPRVYTAEEMRDMFLEQVWVYIDYWEKEECHSKRQALEGLAFSILVILDGESAMLPGFMVMPNIGAGDPVYTGPDGNYFPAVIKNDLLSELDIAGSLHDTFFSFKPKENQMAKKKPVPLSAREAQEIALAQEYVKNYNHGTSGHMAYTVIAKLMLALGVKPGEGLPPELVIDEEAAKRVQWNS